MTFRKIYQRNVNPIRVLAISVPESHRIFIKVRSAEASYIQAAALHPDPNFTTWSIPRDLKLRAMGQALQIDPVSNPRTLYFLAWHRPPRSDWMPSLMKKVNARGTSCLVASDDSLGDSDWTDAFYEIETYDKQGNRVKTDADFVNVFSEFNILIDTDNLKKCCNKGGK
jgi:hypothetical protein